MPVSAPTPAAPSASTISGQVQTELPAVAARRAKLPLDLNESFLYWVSPTEITIHDGEAVYLPIRVGIVHGAQEVGPDGDPMKMHAWQESKKGRRRVPLDFKVQAWGQETTGYLCRMDVGADALGKPLYHFHDVWTRYMVLGSEVIREFDWDGWWDFCQRCKAIIGAEPHPTVVHFETTRVKQLVNEHAKLALKSPAMAEEATRLASTLAPRKGKKKAAEAAEE